MTRARKLRRILLPLAVLAALVAAWQVAAANGAIADALSLEPFLVPSPAEVGEALWDDRTLLWANTWVTLREVLIGFAAGAAGGVLMAVPMRFSPLFRDSFYPLAVAAQAIPVAAIGPILVVWFGYGIGPKIFLVGLFVFFPILVNTLDGLRSVDPEAVKMMRTLYASRWTIFRRVELFAALPPFFTGLKIAAAITPIVALIAELVGSSSGLGRQIISDNANLETARMFAAVLILILIGIALFGVTALIERLVVRWR